MVLNMLNIEYAHHSIETTDSELKQILKELSTYNISEISVLLPHLKLASKNISNNIILSTIIDYPLGISDSISRLYFTNYAIENGAKKIVLLVPQYLLVNKNYQKIKDELVDIKNICEKHNILLFYMLEYRIFTYDTLYKVTKLLQYSAINNIYISTGFGLDNISDHIIAMSMIKKNVPKINIICNANIFNQSHFNLLKECNISSIRLSSRHSLDMASKI